MKSLASIEHIQYRLLTGHCYGNKRNIINKPAQRLRASCELSIGVGIHPSCGPPALRCPDVAEASPTEITTALGDSAFQLQFVSRCLCFPCLGTELGEGLPAAQHRVPFKEEQSPSPQDEALRGPRFPPPRTTSRATQQGQAPAPRWGTFSGEQS